ncbi:hypothetical protein BB14905_04718 [Bacillus sp. B14905]|nr:hypothetical protein BB14905_04718 [Bacillus sp. B14905]
MAKSLEATIFNAVQHNPKQLWQSACKISRIVVPNDESLFVRFDILFFPLLPHKLSYYFSMYMLAYEI